MSRSGNGKSRKAAAFIQNVTYEAAMKRPKVSAVVSSSALQKINSMKAPIGVPEAWQRDAYGYYEVIGELAEVITETASAVAQCDFRPVQIDSENDPGSVKQTTDERVARVWEALAAPRGGKAELVRRAALHLQIAGESLLVGTPIIDEYGADNGYIWNFYSGDEIRVEGPNKVKRNFGYGGLQSIDLDEETYITRLLRSDPRFSERADCAVKHVLPICAEIVLLTQVVDAIAKSRLSAGILYVPDEMSFGPNDETEDDSDETDEIDPFTQEIMEQLTAPVEDRTSAASLVPLIMRGPAEFGDRIKMIEIARNLDTMYQELRTEAIKRLATGLDVPIEIMFGKGGLNHWTGYNIDSDFINRHITPIGDLIANHLTIAYLIPMLMQFEGMEEEEASQYRILFDPSKITSRTDTGPAARAAWQDGEITALAYIRENGFDESDMPTEEERKERDLRRLMISEPIVFGPQIMGMLYPELEGVIKIPGYAPGTGPGDDPQNETGLPERKNPVGRPSDEVIDNETGQGIPTPRGPNGPNMEESLIDKLLVASEGALSEAIQKASEKITASLKKNPDVKNDFASQPPLKRLYLSKEYGVNPHKEFSGWEGDFLSLCVNISKDFYVKDMGCYLTVAMSRATAVSNTLYELVAVLAHTSIENGDKISSVSVPRILVETAVLEANKVFPDDK